MNAAARSEEEVRSMKKKTREFFLKIPSKVDNLEIIRDFISGVANKVGFDSDEANKIELAVDEACTNVIEHAYQNDDSRNIDIAIKLECQKFTIVVTDRGRSFSFNQVDMPNMDSYLAELRVGGLGIYLMKTLMDEVDYQSKPNGSNEVRMVKYLLDEK